jgi:hypothetical protein
MPNAGDTKSNAVAAPERSFGTFGFMGYKDFAPTVLADLPI